MVTMVCVEVEWKPQLKGLAVSSDEAGDGDTK